MAIGRLAADGRTAPRSSPASPAARENASQVREEISSEMWEQLNRLFHEVAQSEVDPAGRRRGDAARLAGARRLLHLPRRHRDDDEPRRGLAVRAARQVHRAGLRGLDAARRLLLDADQGRRSRLGDAARQLRGVRVVLQGLHRRSAAGSDREVPARPPGVPVLGALRRRAHARVARGDRRAVDRPASAAQIERIIGRLRASLAFTPMSELHGGRPARVPERRARAVRARSTSPCTRRTSTIPIEVAFES